MARTTILAVDDDAAGLSAVERDLRQKYGREYRILKAESGSAALTVLQQLKERNEAVALLVADQRMPSMSGVEFLEQAASVFPDARKVLLTAYADTDAAIDAINRVGLDYYLMKPWDPPEEHLYRCSTGCSRSGTPTSSYRSRVCAWSARCGRRPPMRSRTSLPATSLPYRWLDIETRRRRHGNLLEQLVEGDKDAALPCSAPPGRRTSLIQPTTQKRSRSAPASRSHAREGPFYDVIIIGSGPGRSLRLPSTGAPTASSVLLVERHALRAARPATARRSRTSSASVSGISGSRLRRAAPSPRLRRFGSRDPHHPGR